jgi:L-alanine-DL-glutamate epimerase-like enolase superfamily enzyme
VFVYAAGGYYYPGKDDGSCKDEMQQLPRPRLQRGQDEDRRRSLDEDLRRIEAVLACCRTGQRLAVDANGRFDLDTAIAYAKALSQYDLFWYEEPGDPLDYELQATLRNYYANPMATGENLFSMQDARNLIRYGGMRPDRDWLQFDCALSYGLVEYLRTLEMLKEHGWSPSRCIPHGGHQMSLNIAAGLGPGRQRELPRPVPALRRLPRRREGRQRLRDLPDLPGIGFEGKADLYQEVEVGALVGLQHVVDVQLPVAAGPWRAAGGLPGGAGGAPVRRRPRAGAAAGGTSSVIRSPFCTSASGPPAAASGAVCSTTVP